MATGVRGRAIASLGETVNGVVGAVPDGRLVGDLTRHSCAQVNTLDVI